MKRALLFTSALIVAVAPAAMAADFGPIIIGAHFIPGVEATSSGRPWDFSISFGVGIEFDEQNSAEVHVVTDSHVTSVGLWGHFETLINERFGVGAGGTILWPIANQETFLQPVIETYARASVQWDSGAVTSGDLDVSFPIVTLADRGDHWDVIPLASLPSVSAGGGRSVRRRGVALRPSHVISDPRRHHAAGEPDWEDHGSPSCLAHSLRWTALLPLTKRG